MTNEQTNNQEMADNKTQPQNTENNVAAPQVNPSVTQQTQPQEKLVPQSQVNSLLTGKMNEAYEKGKREALAAQPVSQSAQQPTENLSRDEINRIIDAKAQEQAQIAQYNEICNRLEQKVNAGKEKYPDFIEKVQHLNLANPANFTIAAWAETLPNTADVLYELSSNPSKFANVLTLANGGSPALAVAELQRISKSIETNEAAKKEQMPPEPLSQTKPSTIGMDNGSMTVNDFRNQDWLRG